MAEHTVKAFDNEISQLRGQIAEMGGLAEVAIKDAMEALVKRDEAKAQAVVAADARLDALEAEVDRLAVRIIALRAPMADDLRDVIAALKISGVVERTGDLAKNIAKRTLVLNEAEPITPLTRSIERMGRLVLGRLKDVLDAYTGSDLDRAVAVWSRDDEVDEHYNSLFRELLTYMMEDARAITPCTHLLFMAKNLERIGDHATNIAENVWFLINGDQPLPPRDKRDETSTTGAV